MLPLHLYSPRLAVTNQSLKAKKPCSIISPRLSLRGVSSERRQLGESFCAIPSSFHSPRLSPQERVTIMPKDIQLARRIRGERA